MNARILLLVVPILLGCIAPTVRADGESSAELLADFKSVAFTDVKSILVAKIADPGKEGVAASSKGTFHGYALVSDWREVDASPTRTLSELLKKPIDFWIRIYSQPGEGGELVKLDSFCIPHPGYAVRLETDQGERDFLICLECGHVDVFGAGKRSAGFSVESDDLTKLKALYLDQFVLDLGLRKRP